jgi:hypothetical protein
MPVRRHPILLCMVSGIIDDNARRSPHHERARSRAWVRDSRAPSASASWLLRPGYSVSLFDGISMQRSERRFLTLCGLFSVCGWSEFCNQTGWVPQRAVVLVVRTMG